MHRSLAAAWARVIAGRERIVAQVAGYPREFRERRPGPAAWSINEIVEHLTLVDGGVGSALAKEPSPERPRIVPPGRWWRFRALRGALFIGLRIRAPVDAILPRGEISWEEIVTRWAGGHARLEGWLANVPTEILRDPRFRHPIVGWLTIRQALFFMGDHQLHHLNQIQRVERALEGR